MNRRTVLGLSLAALAGCSAPGAPSAGEGQITERQFTLLDETPGGVDARTRENGAMEPAHDAVVRFRSEQRIVVWGALDSGSRSCRETDLEAATYDAQRDALTVVVRDEFVEERQPCTTESVAVPYRATVGFAASLPGTVVVKHRAAPDGGITFEETFR